MSEVMFDFSSIPEVVTDPKDITTLPRYQATMELRRLRTRRSKRHQKRKFLKITLDTPLSALGKFFEWNSAAIVTEKGGIENGGLPKPIAVVTKVDLLSWMVNQTKTRRVLTGLGFIGRRYGRRI